jgi:hypothetical protein
MEMNMFSENIKNNFILIIAIPFLFFNFYCNENNNSEKSSDIKLPPRFKIEIFADNVPGARSMELSPNGVLFVGTRDNDVYAIVDSNKDNKADDVIIIQADLTVLMVLHSGMEVFMWQR